MNLLSAARTGTHGEDEGEPASHGTVGGLRRGICRSIVKIASPWCQWSMPATFSIAPSNRSRPPGELRPRAEKCGTFLGTKYH